MPRRVSLPGASELFRPTRTDEPAQPSRRLDPATTRGEPTPKPVEEPAARDQGRAVAEPAAPQPPTVAEPRAQQPEEPTPAKPAGKSTARAARGSGRVRHEEKITVYVSSEELLTLEQARLTLRARHGMAVDRGRIVREAIAAALADLDQNGAESELIRRLGR